MNDKQYYFTLMKKYVVSVGIGLAAIGLIKSCDSIIDSKKNKLESVVDSCNFNSSFADDVSGIISDYGVYYSIKFKN